MSSEEKVSLRERIGYSTEELVDLAHAIIDPAADLAGEIAAERDAPAGAIVVTFLALDIDAEDPDRFGVLPVKSVWCTSGGIDADRDDYPLSTEGERAWAQLTLVNALARKLQDDAERGALLRGLADSLGRFAKLWGYEITPVEIPEPMPRRDRLRRTTRPSGPGGRSRKQKRKG